MVVYITIITRHRNSHMIILMPALTLDMLVYRPVDDEEMFAGPVVNVGSYVSGHMSTAQLVGRRPTTFLYSARNS